MKKLVELVLLIFVWNCSVIDSSSYFWGYRKSFKAISLSKSNTKIIFAAPHAGSLIPAHFPDRSEGGCRSENSTTCSFHYEEKCTIASRCRIVTVQDFADFDPFVEKVVEEFHRTFSLVPFAIISNWNRKVVDFNREINEATFNYPETVRAYRAYHRYLSRAIEKVRRRYNETAILFDVHQHAQGNYTMIGTLLSASQLNEDFLLNTSIERLIKVSCEKDREKCVRGVNSLGTAMESNGLGIVYPSLENPKPNDKVFYRGGFTTSEHSKESNVIQIEMSFAFRNGFQYDDFISKFVRSIIDFCRINKIHLD